MAGPITLLVAVLFTAAGGAKLIGNVGMVQEFAQIGIGQWFRYFTGILEVSGAVGRSCSPQTPLFGRPADCCRDGRRRSLNLFILHIPVLAGLTAALMVLVLSLSWQWRPALKAGRS